MIARAKDHHQRCRGGEVEAERAPRREVRPRQRRQRRDDRHRADDAGDERQPDFRREIPRRARTASAAAAVCKPNIARRNAIAPAACRRGRRPSRSSRRAAGRRGGAAARGVGPRGQAEPFDDEKRAVEEAPDDEVPARAVPEAAQKEHGDEIAIHPRATRGCRRAARRGSRETTTTATCASAARTPARCRRCTASGSSPGNESRTSVRGRSPCRSSRRSRSRSAACSRRSPSQA